MRSKGSPSYNLVTVIAASVKCRVAALKRLPVLHHRADHIYWSFGIIELMPVCFEYTVVLKPALEGVRDVALFSIRHEQTE